MKWKKDNQEKKDKQTEKVNKKKRKKQTDQIVRIEELEEMLEKYGDDVDPETIVSMYVPHRKRKRIGAALLRMDRLHLILVSMMLAVAVLFIIAFSQEKMEKSFLLLFLPQYHQQWYWHLEVSPHDLLPVQQTYLLLLPALHQLL